MSKYIIKRLLLLIPLTLGVTVLIFTIMYFVPGDPVTQILGANATPVQIEAVRESYGLNDPYLVRLGNYLKDVFLRFDFGRSYITKIEISKELGKRLPYTILVGSVSMLISILIGIPLGVSAAVHQNSIADRICMFIALFGISMPQFWVGLELSIVFALKLKILPATGINGARYLILPCFASAFGGIATLARQSRSSMLEVIRSDYITTARAKGLPRSKVIYKHALRNALIPVITLLGTSLANIFGGSVVIETVFSIPGIGTYMMSGVNNRDYPIVQACVVLLAVIFSVVMLLVDIAYAYVDPRIKAKYERGGKMRRKDNG